MSTSESLESLRRANPRGRTGFAQEVEAAADAVAARITHVEAPSPPRSRRRLVGLSAAGAALAVSTAAAFLTVGLPGGGPGVESATAAFQQAATITAASAKRSGTAQVRITQGGEIWVASTVRWNGADMAMSRDVPIGVRKPGTELIVVDGVMYGVDAEAGGWIVLGSPDSIDPDSGTTPDEYLAAVREDVGGPTLRRITDGMTGLTTRSLADGSTVYSGSVAARLIARESGFKEGEAIRVLPFGFVAHGVAGDPDALLDASVTVGADGVVREVAVGWGTGASAWRYTVTYAGLGTTPAIEAPANAKPFPDRTP